MIQLANELRSRLEELEAIWRRYDATLVASLAKGVSEDAAQASAARVGLEFPRELVVWWGWHNGSAIPSELVGVGATPFDFMSLDQAVALCERHRRAAANFALEMDMSPEDAGWGPSWFPICQSESGALIAAECGEEELAAIRCVGTADEDPAHVDAKSLTEVVGWWIEAHRAGIYYWEAGGWRCRSELVPRELRSTKLL